MLTTMIVAVALWPAADFGPTPPLSNGVDFVMSDTLPQGNRFRFPFTRDEYVLAHVQVMPREEAEARARALYSQDDSEAIGAHVADGDLLLLALLSEELAARVIAYRPTLRTQVEHFRANREAALESWRAALKKP